MKLSNKILAFFEEKLSKLDNHHLDSLSKSLLNYTNDWPEEVFTVNPDGVIRYDDKGEYEDDNIEDAEVSIDDVEELFGVILDSEDFEIDFKNVSEKDLAQVFGSLEGKSFKVKTKAISLYKGQEDEDDCEIGFTIVNCKYHKNKDMIEVKVKNVKLVG